MEQISNSQLQDSRQQWPALMGRAMELAARVLSAHPNPRVGCVLEKQGRIIAEGWHEAPGLPHAESGYGNCPISRLRQGRSILAISSAVNSPCLW
jgi:deoxycytidylate deaminase